MKLISKQQENERKNYRMKEKIVIWYKLKVLCSQTGK